jgi:hypothetical protein
MLDDGHIKPYLLDGSMEFGFLAPRCGATTSRVKA